MMANRSRILILLASLALGLMYVLPVWTINLEAPQYPEGLGMVIRLDNIEGKKQHDLNNINNLNHYIGMKRIEPDSIPELRVMPAIVGFLMVLGLLVAAVGRRSLLYGWTIAFLAISLVGLVDFWKWEYDYGHNLDDENAIIKIPGMSYQPPLIGSRQILNFTAHSWPGAGGWAAILAAMTAVGVSAIELRNRGRTPTRTAGRTPDPDEEPSSGTAEAASGVRRTTTKLGAPAGTAVLALALLTGCGEPEPRALVAGVDGCADCLMVVDAEGHGAEIVGTTGKVYTFDSAECMVNHLLTAMPEDAVHSVWVTDFSSPDELVRADEAFYLVSETLTSPMGLGVTAFRRAQDRDGAVHAFGGEPADWRDIRELVAEAWPNGRPPMGHGGHAETMPPPALGG